MRTYRQLTQEQRYQISVLKKPGYGPTEIAEELEVHKSTISCELRRNTGERGYRPKQTNEKAFERRANATPRKCIRAETWEAVEEKLRQDWSPEQVSGWLEKHQAAFALRAIPITCRSAAALPTDVPPNFITSVPFIR